MFKISNLLHKIVMHSTPIPHLPSVGQALFDTGKQ